MVSDSSSNSLTLSQATQLRAQAVELLERLLANRSQSEQRMAELNRRDALKAVTGKTSLDNAIASAREMILQMDLLIEQMQSRPTEIAADGCQQPGPDVHTIHRNGVRSGRAAVAMAGGARSVHVPLPASSAVR